MAGTENQAMTGSTIKSRDTAREALEKVLTKLFLGKEDGKERCLYRAELEQAAKETSHSSPELVRIALEELKAESLVISVDRFGRIKDLKKLGPCLSALLEIVNRNLDICFISSREQLASPRLPLSDSLRAPFAEIIDAGETAVIMFVRNPPEEAALEIRHVTDEKLYGLMSMWADTNVHKDLGLSPALQDYLRFATVRVFCTGKDQKLQRRIEAINLELERDGGFEDAHWIRVLKGVSQGEKAEALKDSLKVCIPIVIGVKFLEVYFPGGLHAIGGLLDDLFGAILPDVSQSMGRKDLPRRERITHAWGVLKGGLLSLPLAALFGWYSAVLHAGYDSTAMHALAGVLFALACSLGTVGTSIAAFGRAYRSIGKLAVDATYGSLVKGLGTTGKMRLAFKESIMDVPFRIGHTVIGVPIQIALGVCAGVFGFFHNGVFVMLEGMAETILGALTAFLYPIMARHLHYSRLRRGKFDGIA